MQFDLTVTIDRPVEEVFAYLSDISRTPEWAGPPVEREKLTEGSIGVGTRIRAVDKLPGRRVVFIEEVTVYEPNQRITVRMEEPYNGDLDFVFEGTNNTTRLAASMDLKPTGLMGILSSMLAGRIKRLFQKDLDNLKTILESNA